MQEETSASQATASAAGTDAPPVVSHRRAIAATAFLLALWATVTLGATPLTPWIQGVAESVEVALGLDIMLGPRDEPKKAAESKPE